MSRVLPNLTPKTEVDFSGQLRGKLARSFREECERRGIEPATLAADILETVIRDDLYAAVLDA